MHKSILLFLLVCFTFIACNDNLVEVKNASNQVIESFEITADSVKNGFYKKFYDDGKLKEATQFINGKIEGERLLYYPNGTVEIRENYINGNIDAGYFEYHPNGQINIQFNYSNGNINGELVKYFENGKLAEKVTFSDGEENGPFKEYFENGLIHWDGSYLNGDNEFGLLKEFDENGQLIKKMMCDSLAVCRTIWTLKDGDITPKY